MSDQSDPERLSDAEIGKDAIQTTVEAAAATIGEVAVIITNAVKDIASAVGGLATDLFEVQESVKKARSDG